MELLQDLVILAAPVYVLWVMRVLKVLHQPQRGHVITINFVQQETQNLEHLVKARIPNEAPGGSRLCPGGTFGNVTGLARLRALDCVKQDTIALEAA
ncbi:hypothetical protein GQ600_17567 [Phytophthora cactorum]|nr:hypothetical protein GQ600_17567 [Phytophthora cactorum]